MLNSCRINLIYCFIIFVFNFSKFVNGTVTVISNGDSYSFPSLQALFGPSLTNTISGRIQIAQPDMYGCSALTLNTSSDSNSVIVLIKRSDPINQITECTFETKVYNAQNAGASAVIVYDYKQEDLFFMSSINSVKIEIPSVLVQKSSAIQIKSLVNITSDPAGPLCSIDASYLNYSSFNQDLPGLIVGCFCGSVIFFFCCYICRQSLCHFFSRSRRNPHRSYPRVAPPSINMNVLNIQETMHIPEITVLEDSVLFISKESCSICLNEYQIGDKLKKLLCQHLFHSQCLLPWLTEHNRSCPLCKGFVSVSTESPHN